MNTLAKARPFRSLDSFPVRSVFPETFFLTHYIQGESDLTLVCVCSDVSLDWNTVLSRVLKFYCPRDRHGSYAFMQSDTQTDSTDSWELGHRCLASIKLHLLP